MSTTLTNESKNSLAVSNEAKDASITWDQATYTWDEAVGTWDVPGVVISKESKNSLSISNENKN